MVKRRFVPTDSQAWRSFLKNQAKAMWSGDFFVQHTVGFRVLCVFVIMELANRKVIHMHVTDHPTLEGRHDVLPWFNYFLSTLRLAYREFEDRAGRQRPARGSKAELIACGLENLQSPFGIADVERLCPNVSREMIRVILNRRREEGRLEVLGRGRDAKWRRTDRK